MLKNLFKFVGGVVVVIGIPYIIIANFLAFLAILGFLVLAFVALVAYYAVVT